MLFFLSLGLFPLGLIAILASIASARDNNADRAAQAYARLEMRAQRLDATLTRSAGTIRASAAAIALTPRESGVCEQTLLRLTRAQSIPIRFALFSGRDRIRCATPGFVPVAIANPNRARSRIDIAPDGGRLRFTLYGVDGQPEGIGEFAREDLARLTYIPEASGDFDLELQQGSRTMILRDGYRDGPLVHTVHATAPVAGGRLTIAITSGAVPISAAELLMILLPVLMWMFAAGIGWLIVDRLLLKPLVQMQRAVSAYAPGDRNLDLPALSTPAREIGELGLAFDQVTQTVARHEADLEAAIERQTKLVREVHHRVKNNLQVVASLLNLHARGATNEEVAAAYASIQRRVDALAVVHRNHFAELEVNRGVALKPLISELGANLRATAPPHAASMSIRIDIEPYYVTQDVAVSVAFLITEVVEFAMFCGARTVAVSLGGKGPGVARLLIESGGLRAGTDDDPGDERFERVITGLTRQLRSVLERDRSAGRYALDIAVLEKGE